MIDILKAQKTFKDYVKNYNPEDKKIKLKIAHIERTSRIAKKIAQSLNLSQEDVELAELIGLLHDIGRFEQIKVYNTFSDAKSVNHGEYGVKILFEENKIRDYIDTDIYDGIIRKAILNHNKSIIEEGLNDRELLHAKIIRDADKTDIFYILTFEELETAYETKNMSILKISDEIFREFVEDKHINYKNIQNPSDLLIAHFAYVYDIYFDYTLKYINENQYIEKLHSRFDFEDKKTNDRYNQVYEIAQDYIKC